MVSLCEIVLLVKSLTDSDPLAELMQIPFGKGNTGPKNRKKAIFPSKSGSPLRKAAYVYLHGCLGPEFGL